MSINHRPLWIEIKSLEKRWHSNPGIKYAAYLRTIAERIPVELGEGRLPRNHTAQDVVNWLIEQAEKGEQDIRYNYPWELTDTH